MKAKTTIVAAVTLLWPHCWAGGEPSNSSPKQAAQPDAVAAGAAAAEHDAERRADKRHEEMLNKMQAAVEEIAQLYGNPVFLQVFTNDAERASELKQRLKAARSWDDIRRELAGLEKKRDELLNDIALKEREAARLTGRLVRQRSALDALATAVEAARKAVEETAK
jgi:hypothetical protein